MSITSELRDFVDELACHKVTRDMLREIADRIDAQHEECAGFCRRLEDAAKGGAEVTIFGTDYIPLPKDADGVTIRIGDEVEVIGYEDGTVAALQLDERHWSVAVRPHGWDTPTAYDAESIRHVKPDSWERIIEDAQADGVRWHNDGKPSDFDALVERCKRLAGEDS